MERFAMFQNLMVMAAADGKFTDEEVELLALRANRWGLSDEQFDQALQYVTSGMTELTLPEDPKTRRTMLRELIEVMAADGELAATEKRLFAEAAARMEISADELDQMIDGLL